MDTLTHEWPKAWTDRIDSFSEASRECWLQMCRRHASLVLEKLEYIMMIASWEIKHDQGQSDIIDFKNETHDNKGQTKTHRCCNSKQRTNTAHRKL